MSSRLVALVAVALLCPSAAAQSQFSADPGLYVVLDDLDPVPFGDDRVGLGGGAGWRFASGWDAGLEFGVGLTDFGRRFETNAFGGERRVRVGVAVGRTVPLGDRAGVRVEGAAGLGRTSVDRRPTRFTITGAAVGPDSQSFLGNEGRVRADLGVFRRIPLGRVTVQPTGLVGASGAVVTRTDPGGRFTLRADAEGGSGTASSVRLGVALPVSTSLLGRVLTVEPRFTVVTDRGTPDATLRLRIN